MRSAILWVSIILFLVCTVFYYMKLQALTVPYGDARVIRGTVYTPKGADYTSKNPGKTTEEIIEDFAGQTEEIWTEGSINSTRLVLGLSYSAAVAFLELAVLACLRKYRGWS